MTRQELDDKAKPIFRLFLETVMARAYGNQYSDWNFGDNPAFAHFDKWPVGEMRKLAEFFRNKRQSDRGMIYDSWWESHPEVLGAILLHLGVTEEEYLVATGKKKHRSIDDI